MNSPLKNPQMPIIGVVFKAYHSLSAVLSGQDRVHLDTIFNSYNFHRVNGAATEIAKSEGVMRSGFTAVSAARIFSELTGFEIHATNVGQSMQRANVQPIGLVGASKFYHEKHWGYIWHDLLRIVTSRMSRGTPALSYPAPKLDNLEMVILSKTQDNGPPADFRHLLVTSVSEVSVAIQGAVEKIDGDDLNMDAGDMGQVVGDAPQLDTQLFLDGLYDTEGDIFSEIQSTQEVAKVDYTPALRVEELEILTLPTAQQDVLDPSAQTPQVEKDDDPNISLLKNEGVEIETPQKAPRKKKAPSTRVAAVKKKIDGVEKKQTPDTKPARKRAPRKTKGEASSEAAA